MINFSFVYLTLGAFAYLSSSALYPTGMTTVAVNHRLLSHRISSYFTGSNPSIGHASIFMLAHTVSSTPIAIYACF